MELSQSFKLINQENISIFSKEHLKKVYLVLCSKLTGENSISFSIICSQYFDFNDEVE